MQSPLGDTFRNLIKTLNQETKYILKEHYFCLPFHESSKPEGRNLMETFLLGLSAQYVAVVLCICSQLLHKEYSWIMTGQGTYLRLKQNVIKSHFTAMFPWQNNNILFSPGLLTYPVSGPWPLKQYQAWVPSHRMGLKSNQIMKMRQGLFSIPSSLLRQAFKNTGSSC